MAVVCLLALVACPADRPGSDTTSAATTASPSPCPDFVLARNDGVCDDAVDVDGETYRVRCVPVPELLLDVSVDARWGGGAVRTIAAVPREHAVAVFADDRACGSYAIAIRSDLPVAVADAIVAEVERAASLPPDLPR